MTSHALQTTGAQELIEGLGVSLKLSQDLLALLGEENSALRAMATQDLFRISRQKLSLLTRLNRVDEAIKKLLPEAGEEAAYTTEQERLIGQYRQRISEARDAILAQNRINKRLTEDTLGYLNDAITLITRPNRTDAVYRAPGRAPGRSLTLPAVISRAV